MTDKTVTRRLSTGHTIKFPVHVERMLKKAYDHFAGFSTRKKICETLDKKNLARHDALLSEVPTKHSLSTVDTFIDEDLERMNIKQLQDRLDNFETFYSTITVKDIEALFLQYGVPINTKKIDVRNYHNSSFYK